MKRFLLIIVAAAMFLLASPAYADSVKITTQAAFTNPSGSPSSETYYDFKGPQTITFSVAGKTCNLNGSARGSVPTGCNYVLTLAPNGSLAGQLSAGNSVCTQSQKRNTIPTTMTDLSDQEFMLKGKGTYNQTFSLSLNTGSLSRLKKIGIITPRFTLSKLAQNFALLF